MTLPTTGDLHDAAAVREFFDGWSLYKRIVDNDYLCHRSAKRALCEWFDGFDRPFSFLDLGCGDAAFSAEILSGRPVSSYTGMDLSPVALDLAMENTRRLMTPVSLVSGDFLTGIAALPADSTISHGGRRSFSLGSCGDALLPEALCWFMIRFLRPVKAGKPSWDAGSIMPSGPGTRFPSRRSPAPWSM